MLVLKGAASVIGGVRSSEFVVDDMHGAVMVTVVVDIDDDGDKVTKESG